MIRDPEGHAGRRVTPEKGARILYNIKYKID
jgi:hypothetical protein